jgi:hypothetical protein
MSAQTVQRYTKREVFATHCRVSIRTFAPGYSV